MVSWSPKLVDCVDSSLQKLVGLLVEDLKLPFLSSEGIGSY